MTTNPNTPSTKHTPGPWRIEPADKGLVITHSDAEHRSHVARLFTGVLCPEHGSIEANARLIAAAPGLLAALHEILIASQVHDSTTGYYQPLNPYTTAKIARAALAQAEEEMK